MKNIIEFHENHLKFVKIKKSLKIWTDTEFTKCQTWAVQPLKFGNGNNNFIPQRSRHIISFPYGD